MGHEGPTATTLYAGGEGLGVPHRDSGLRVHVVRGVHHLTLSVRQAELQNVHVSAWSTEEGRCVMQIVHEDVEVPFLPYLGRLALMAIEDRDDQDAVCSTCSHL